MKVIKEEDIKRIHIEYDIENNGRQKVFDWLDETYGEFEWRSQRSGPFSNDRGLVIALVQFDHHKRG